MGRLAGKVAVITGANSGIGRRVANVLPAVLNNPDFLYVTERPSLIAIREVLHGTLPPKTNAILLTQLGGQVGRCKMVVDADPLVKFNDEYVLFLRADRRTYPSNTSGSPRYSAVGDWSGKAKILNEKIQFLPAAHKRLHQYDNSDASAFIELVKQRIGIIFPKK